MYLPCQYFPCVNVWNVHPCVLDSCPFYESYYCLVIVYIATETTISIYASCSTLFYPCSTLFYPALPIIQPALPILYPALPISLPLPYPQCSNHLPLLYPYSTFTLPSSTLFYPYSPLLYPYSIPSSNSQGTTKYEQTPGEDLTIFD